MKKGEVAMIEFQHLTKKYGNKTALNDLNLTIKTGEIFGFLGHNGAGKSTTIKSLVSVIEPTSGSITVEGLSLTEIVSLSKKALATCRIRRICF